MMLPAATVALVWVLRLVEADFPSAGAGDPDPEALILPDALSSEMQDLLGVGLTTTAPAGPESNESETLDGAPDADEGPEALPVPAPLSRRAGSPWARARDRMVSPEDLDFMTMLRPPPLPTAKVNKPSAQQKYAAPSKGRKQNKKGGGKASSGKVGGKRGSKQNNKQNNKQSTKASPSMNNPSSSSSHSSSYSSPSYSSSGYASPSYASPSYASPSYASPNYSPSSYSPNYLNGFSPSYAPMPYPPSFYPNNVYRPEYFPPYHPAPADPYANHLYDMSNHNHYVSGDGGVRPTHEPDVFQASSSSPLLETNTIVDTYQRPTFPKHSDQRPSGSASVQLSQSIQAAEHHSTHTNWQLTTLPPPSPSLSATTLAPSSSTTAASKKATLRDILAQDCPGAEDIGYCDSPPRYPTQQVSDIIQKCSHIMDYLYAPVPEEFDDGSDNNSIASDADGDGDAACASVRRPLRPGYVRDAVSGRWLVALQSRGPVRVEQRVAAERCGAPGRACARLAQSKCARNLGFRNGARATTCEQRFLLIPLLTWDPEAPATCPRMRQARFPSACVCRLS